MIVLSNAGPLIALSKLNRLNLLSELYGTVLVPRTVEGRTGHPELARKRGSRAPWPERRLAALTSIHFRDDLD